MCINIFHQDEEEIYNLQIKILGRKLVGSDDGLSDFTCHSIPHIREVMEQCDMLFSVMQNWLIEEIGFSEEDLPSAKKHLMLAAKFHDIGMAGTKSLRDLLIHVDKMYYSYLNPSFDLKEMHSRLTAEFKRLVETAENDISGWDRKSKLYDDRLYGRILGSDPYCENMTGLISKYHDMVQKTIRASHGESSFRWIIENKKKLADRYGNDLNWEFIALLAGLHTNSFLSHTDPEGKPHSCGEYCDKLCKLMEIHPVFLEDPKEFNHFQALAGILRLGDQRRSGSRARSLMQKNIQIIKKMDGKLCAAFENDGSWYYLQTKKANDIILSEQLNEFKKVVLEKNNDCWQMTHHMIYTTYDQMDTRKILLTNRIPSYTEEILDSILTSNHKIKHVLKIQFSQPEGESCGSIIQMNYTDIKNLEKCTGKLGHEEFLNKITNELWKQVRNNINITLEIRE